MNEITITVSMGTTVPQYGKTAAGLLAACRKFWENPENEAEYQKQKKGGKTGERVLGGGDRVPDRECGGDHRDGDPEWVA